MSPPKSLAVFCGASSGNSPSFIAAARSVGVAFAEANCELIYGGGQLGLMGEVARACLETKGGRVLGVIPTAFLGKPSAATIALRAAKEGTKTDLHAENGGRTECFPISELSRQTEVSSMHERKQIMAKESEGFLGLPGGFGTLEEVMEMTTWTQLGIHKKPVILLNVDGFYSPLRDFIEGGIKSGFIAPANRAFLTFLDAPPQSDSTTTTQFDWGRAALAAVEAWTTRGVGGGQQYDLEWADDKAAFT